MNNLFEGIGYFLLFVGIAVMMRSCHTDSPLIGPKGIIYDTRIEARP